MAGYFYSYALGPSAVRGVGIVPPLQWSGPGHLALVSSFSTRRKLAPRSNHRCCCCCCCCWSCYSFFFIGVHFFLNYSNSDTSEESAHRTVSVGERA
ncbi:unnamed protein product [Polarella glacialis]|uniref:Uncharacterized protein n=1 Tax=Polarella glacialis TaxID=89957 RepID=A0A813G4V8_POLGL|nr:unnamed protein product [Polarella glacialis]